MCDCGQRASLLESALSLLTTLLSDETDDTYLIALRLVVSLLEGDLASVGFNCSHCGEVSRYIVLRSCYSFPSYNLRGDLFRDF